MKLHLAAAAVVLLLSPRADTLTFAIEKGAKLDKHFELGLEFHSDTIQISIDGKPLPDEVLEKFEITMSTAVELEVEDEYRAVEKGRPSELLRHFRKVQNHETAHEALPAGKPKDRDETHTSPLEDHAVEFRWNAKDESWERSFSGGEGDKASLEPLHEDMDFLALVEGGKLEEGASWKIDVAHFAELVKPGGELSFPKKKDANVQFEFGKNASGKIEASYGGTREEGGRKLAVIKLEAHVKTSQEANPDAPMPLALEGGLELEGEYLWDLAAQHLASYSIHGPATLVATGERTLTTKNGEATMKMRFEFAGELKAKGRIE
ncbi:MAG: hypothetical protein IPJ19_11850 [Planctomycetes bacterium]|nr:hypothetical protein [Planctomycetota bacterium]